MSLPNNARADIDAAKIRDYLLSPAHPVGRFKAAFFTALGYSRDAWPVLRDDLLTLARGNPATEKSGPFGRIFEVDGMLIGPSGRCEIVRTVWIIRTAEDSPRFVTAYPR
jgi:hypothetical protein